MKGKRTSIYRNSLMDTRLKDYESRYEGLSSAITVIVDRYAELMAIERRELRKLFSQEEINIMLNNALSTCYEPAGIVAGAVLADTEDEIESQFEFFEVDRDVLLAKLRGLNVGQQFALVDWLEELRAKADKE
jgi:hypothetical protein